MIKRGGMLFNEAAKKFRVDWKDSNSYIAATLQLNSVLEASKHAKGKLIDVGCGEKPFLHVFTKIKSYIGIDMPTTLHINKEIDAFSSGTSIAFKDKSFDTVLTTSVIEHVQKPQKMFDEMYRVLRKNGYLILTTPFQYGLHEQPNDYFRYTKYSLRLMAEKSGFKIVYIKPIGGMLTIIAQLISKYIAILLYLILEKIRGNKIEHETGFQNIKRNVLVQLIAFVPQKLYLILYNLGLKKLDNLSAKVDTLMYVMVAKK